MLTLLLFLQVADAVTTYAVIKRGGREINPVLVWLDTKLRFLSNSRWAWLVVGKLIAIFCGIYLYCYGHQTVLSLLTAGYLFVVIHNFRQLKKS